MRLFSVSKYGYAAGFSAGRSLLFLLLDFRIREFSTAEYRLARTQADSASTLLDAASEDSLSFAGRGQDFSTA